MPLTLHDHNVLLEPVTSPLHFTKLCKLVVLGKVYLRSNLSRNLTLATVLTLLACSDVIYRWYRRLYTLPMPWLLFVVQKDLEASMRKFTF